MKLRAMVLLTAVLLVAALTLSACSGSSSSGGESTVKGLVTKVDTDAKTFTVDASGKTYDFKMASSSKGDIKEIKEEHQDKKKEIDVKYKGSSSPYEVVSAD